MLQLLSLASLLFTGLVLGIVTTISVPMVVYAANIQGTPGDDILNGTSKADIIKGFEGNDKLFGEAGNDGLDGGSGNDEMYGGDGKDRINEGNNEAGELNRVYAGSGNDNIDVGTVHGTGTSYYIHGESGRDDIEVMANEAYVYGGLDDDTIYCTGEQCYINGDEGNDEIQVQLYDVGSYVQGDSGNDKIFGGGYSFDGGSGNDYLSTAQFLEGGEGDDYLELADSYNGGPGADTFKCSSASPFDTIEDYNPEEGDKIVNIEDCETVEGT
jgi:Ca2+-binding RTX toxin-like protein